MGCGPERETGETDGERQRERNTDGETKRETKCVVCVCTCKAALLLIQFPAYAPGKAAEHGPSRWALHPWETPG